MGSSGTGLFDDDTAYEVRDSFRESLELTGDDDAAREAVLAEFADALADVDERPIVWLALAHTQSKLGRLDPQTRQTALDILDAGADLARWEAAGPRAVKSRARALEAVRAQLLGPQPARKKIKKPARPTSHLGPGTVLSHRAPSGRLFLMVVARVVETDYYKAPLIRFLGFGDSAPSPDDLRELPYQVATINGQSFYERLVIEHPGMRAENYGLEVAGSIPVRSEPALAGPLDSSSSWPFVIGLLDDWDRQLDSADQ